MDFESPFGLGWVLRLGLLRSNLEKYFTFKCPNKFLNKIPSCITCAGLFLFVVHVEC